jgi:hypothetical protein
MIREEKRYFAMKFFFLLMYCFLKKKHVFFIYSMFFELKLKIIKIYFHNNFNDLS